MIMMSEESIKRLRKIDPNERIATREDVRRWYENLSEEERSKLPTISQILNVNINLNQS